MQFNAIFHVVRADMKEETHIPTSTLTIIYSMHHNHTISYQY